MDGFVLDHGLLVILGVIALGAFATEGAIGFGGTVLAASVGVHVIPLDILLPAFVPLNMVMSTWLLVRGLPAVSWRMLATEIAPAVGLGAVYGAVVNGPSLRDDAGNHPQPRDRALIERMTRDAAHDQRIDFVGPPVQVDQAARHAG